MRILSVVALSLLVSGPAMAQDTLPDVDRFGPQVGQPVPDFSLVDQSGTSRDLASLMGPEGLMLVFSRSADW